MGEKYLTKIEWVLCPICSNKTRIKIRPDTVLENFPLFCPKCKKESLIDVKNFEVKEVYDNGDPTTTQTYKTYLKNIKEKKIKYQQIICKICLLSMGSMV